MASEWRPPSVDQRVRARDITGRTGSVASTQASTEALRGDRLSAVLSEDIEDAFAFADAQPPLAEQLHGLVLQPGESFSFDIGRFVPMGALAPGRYGGGGLGLAFRDDAGREQAWSPDRTLVVTVREGGGGAPLPEPSTPALLLAAAALAAGTRLRRAGSRCR